MSQTFKRGKPRPPDDLGWRGVGGRNWSGVTKPADRKCARQVKANERISQPSPPRISLLPRSISRRRWPRTKPCVRAKSEHHLQPKARAPCKSSSRTRIRPLGCVTACGLELGSDLKPNCAKISNACFTPANGEVTRRLKTTVTMASSTYLYAKENSKIFEDQESSEPSTLSYRRSAITSACMATRSET